MSLKEKLGEETRDPLLAEALGHFKASVDAWSAGAMSRPRKSVAAARRGATAWRTAGGWALGLVLAAGSVAGVLYERHHRQESARMAAIKGVAEKAAQERAMAKEPAALGAAIKDEDLLATVDNDISRAVPAAMEPLAQMMYEKPAENNGTE